MTAATEHIPIPEQSFGIIGWPLGHSLSPLIHNWAFQQHNLPCCYLRWEVKPEAVEAFLGAVRTLPISGVSVTIPHKVTVMPGLDEVSPAARQVGAVNTLFWREGELVGDNTDVTGFLAPLRGRSRPFGAALVLGAGGAARAALAGLRQLGVATLVSNRSRDKAEALAAAFDASVVDWERRTEADADLVVNTTPLGMTGDYQEETPWPSEAMTKRHTFYDLVYNPINTRLLDNARQAGAGAISGLAMFVGQAEAQFRLWTGLDLPDGAEELVRRALAGGR
jgi:shikimate dehydrogenase